VPRCRTAARTDATGTNTSTNPGAGAGAHAAGTGTRTNADTAAAGCTCTCTSAGTGTATATAACTDSSPECVHRAERRQRSHYQHHKRQEPNLSQRPAVQTPSTSLHGQLSLVRIRVTKQRPGPGVNPQRWLRAHHILLIYSLCRFSPINLK
jgi:hypothetical protein